MVTDLVVEVSGQLSSGIELRPSLALAAMVVRRREGKEGARIRHRGALKVNRRRRARVD